MEIYKFDQDDTTGEVFVDTPVKGKSILSIPQLNKGTAFTNEERWALGLKGKLPYNVESIEQQSIRAYEQYCRFETPLSKNIYLRSLHDVNEPLFYHLVSTYLDEMLPIIYTPTVGESVQHYSREFRRARGLFIAYPDRHRIPELLGHRTNPNVSIIVASDAEGVLGIGDQGIGGMDIPVAKLMVYTLCAGINPSTCLPVFLDVGTNNKQLLEDPLYLGWRHRRMVGKDYDEMMSLFVEAVKDAFPDVFLHWEDFGRDNARRNLERFQDLLCTFNDDMQGTGAVTVSALLAAVRAAEIEFTDQRVVIFGAGTAGAGIAEQICDAMVELGMKRHVARKRFWFIDRHGLITKDMDNLTPIQQLYARDPKEVKDWFRMVDGQIDLYEVIRQIKPSTLVGCSTVRGAFNQQVIRALAAGVSRPIILPLSNPTNLSEAHPQDLLEWTSGKALIATGSPFGEVQYRGSVRQVAQCNNALIFPGIGLGVVAVKARALTQNMLWAACQQLSQYSPAINNPIAPILPCLGEARRVSRGVAGVVAKQAILDGVAELKPGETVAGAIDKLIWSPQYYRYRYESVGE